ncbi:MAG TPA: hypothetical protein VF996_03230 [Candidatus Saccharimonadales bacterium]
MNHLRTRIVRLGAGLAALTTGSALAQVNTGIADTQSSAGATSTDLPAVINGAINVLLYIVGVAAVVMLIVGGIRYIVSSGDQQAVAGAKNTIIYSIVGIIIAVLAYAAVNFVFDTLGGA